VVSYRLNAIKPDANIFHHKGNTEDGQINALTHALNAVFQEPLFA
jgi:hypothetical protein